MELHFKSVMGAIQANPSIALDTNQITELALTKMEEALNNIIPSEQDQEITFVLKADKSDSSKWMMSVSNRDTLNELYLAFFFGEKNMSAIETRMNEIMAKEMSSIKGV